MIVKICGILSLEAALAAGECGADLIGFVFAESRRKISVEKAAQISSIVPAPGKVGVFVNQPLSEVRAIAEYCRLDYIQLHGEEGPGYLSSLNRPLIRAVRVGNSTSQAAVAAYACEWLLLDSFVPGQPGGTGISFDWEATRILLGGLPQKVFVAGGLNPQNVSEAIRILRPDGVDVSGGVENDGVKDPEKIRRFIEAARAAERNCHVEPDR